MDGGASDNRPRSPGADWGASAQAAKGYAREFRARVRAVKVEEWVRLAEAFEARVAACAELPFQSLPAESIEVTDPLSGRRVVLNPARAGRPRAGSAVAAYREGRTPPTLSFVPQDGPPVPVVEGEAETLAAARDTVAAASGGTDRDAGVREQALSPWEIVGSFGARTRTQADGARVPLVFPSVPWKARTFFNLAPIVADRTSGANGFVVAVAAEHERADLGRLMRPVSPASPGPCAAGLGAPGEWSPVLPPPVFEAVIYSWALLEQWAESRALVSVPFINGGKGAASGQSLDCFHAQFYALDPEPLPPYYEALRRAAERGECPLCRLVSSRELEVTRVGSVGVWAHPAPETEATLVVAALGHEAALAALPDPADLARGIASAVRCFEHLLGGVPPYNVSVRCGRYAGHLHAEVIPRAGVAVAAGFEKATGLWVSTRSPAHVAAALRGRAKEPAAELRP